MSDYCHRYSDTWNSMNNPGDECGEYMLEYKKNYYRVFENLGCKPKPTNLDVRAQLEETSTTQVVDRLSSETNCEKAKVIKRDLMNRYFSSANKAERRLINTHIINFNRRCEKPQTFTTQSESLKNQESEGVK